MRKLIAITQVTLDGVMQAPEIIARDFAMLLGRRTYEIFAAYWPNHGDNPIGKTFDNATKYVVTRSLDRVDWKQSQRIDGDVVEEVRRLKASDGPELHVWGSGELLQALIAADLVDEYRMWVFPVAARESGCSRTACRRVSSRWSRREARAEVFSSARTIRPALFQAAKLSRHRSRKRNWQSQRRAT